MQQKNKKVELLDSLKAGDEKAFELLYDSYSAAVYGVILRIVHVEEVAEEVLQETFLKIWHKIDAYNPEKGALFTWMINIAKNLSIDKTRSKAYKNQKSTDVVDKFTSQSFTLNIDTIGLREKVNGALQKNHRLIIEKMYFEGYSQKDISKELNIPIGTVKSRARAAIIKLREALKD